MEVCIVVSCKIILNENACFCGEMERLWKSAAGEQIGKNAAGEHFQDKNATGERYYVTFVFGTLV